MLNSFIEWIKDRCLKDLLWKITKFQLVYIALTIFGDIGNEILIGLGTIFKLLAMGWCVFSIWTYFNNEKELVDTYAIDRKILFMVIIFSWILEAIIWGNLITKLATMDFWIIPQNGFSCQNLHNGGEYYTMACLLIVITLILGLILKTLQCFWYPYKMGNEEEISPVLYKIGEFAGKEVNIEFARKVCVIISAIIVICMIYPVVDIFVLTSDNVVNSNRDVKKYFEKEYNLKMEYVETYKDKKDYKHYLYTSEGKDNHSAQLIQRYVVPGIFEKGVPRWEVKLIYDGEEIKINQ